MPMKKIIFCCLLSSFFMAQAHAQTIDLLDDGTLTADTADKSSNTNDAAQTISEQTENTDDSQDQNFLSFITKPISLLFSADDKVETADGKEETYLEKSTRQANEGNLDDQMNLAYMYLYGSNGVKQDFAQAFKYYEMAANQNNPIALNNLGSLYFNGIGTDVNVPKSLEYFSKAAELGNDNAATNLAFIYLKGGAKDPARNKKAMDLFKKASASGNNIAKFMLGYAYYIGFVYPQNYDKAFKLIQSAAKKNGQLDEAQIVLAEMYINGHGTVQNYIQGINAYRAAVNQGNSEAYMKLADIYVKGQITPPNLIMAHSLYNVASVQEEPGAAKKRDMIGKNLKFEQLLQAQTSAQNFKPTPSELTIYVRRTFGFNIRNYINMNTLTTKESN